MGLGFGWLAALGKVMVEFEDTAIIINIMMKVLGGDVFNFLVVSSVFLVAFSASAATLYLREDEDTGKLLSEHSIADYFFMQFMWAIVEYPSLELGFDSPHAGLRHIGGAILMLFFALFVAVIGNKIFIAMMTSTYQNMKLEAELNFKFRRVSRVVYYASAPREPSVSSRSSASPSSSVTCCTGSF